MHFVWVGGGGGGGGEFLALLDMSRKEIFGEKEGRLGVSDIGLGDRSLGYGGGGGGLGFGVWGERARRLRISSYFPLSGDVLI